MILKLVYGRAEGNTKRNSVRIFSLLINLNSSYIANNNKAKTKAALRIKAATA